MFSILIARLHDVSATRHFLRYNSCLPYFNRDWKFEHPERSNGSSPIPIKLEQAPMSYSMRLARVGERSLFSKEVLYSLVITNVLSILLGAGIGWVQLRFTLNDVSPYIDQKENNFSFPFSLLFLAFGLRNAVSYLLVCQLSKQSSSALRYISLGRSEFNQIKVPFSHRL